jgi:hypothetical protein
MSTHGLPNDVLSNLDPLALIIFIPIFDIIVCPFSNYSSASYARIGIPFLQVHRPELFGFEKDRSGLLHRSHVDGLGSR